MSKRVLMVDDSKATRSMVAFTLRRAGYTVLEAEDGEQAIRTLGEQPIDCLITDVNMPGMDGKELVRRLRESPAHRAMPILLLTTTFDGSQNGQAMQAGATGWLGKPFLPADLIEAVAKIV
jgi:two-component system chemotaxis response regulator CheY